MSRIACIGTRTTPVAHLPWLEETGMRIVGAGHTLVSGNAPGADQAWARGGNKVDPTKVELWLPWASFEQATIHPQNVVRCVVASEESQGAEDAFQLCAQFHPRWSQLKSPARQLLARNVLLVRDCKCVVGYLEPFISFHQRAGGTSFAFKVARHFNIPVHNVAKPEVREAFDWTSVTGPIFP